MSAELSEAERRNLLQICRAVMPGVAGVLLSTSTGSLVAHEETCRDPATLAQDAACLRHPAGQSALVPRESGLYLVVFVPPQLVTA